MAGHGDTSVRRSDELLRDWGQNSKTAGTIRLTELKRQDEKDCIACNILRTKCEQLHTKLLVVKILDFTTVHETAL